MGDVFKIWLMWIERVEMIWKNDYLNKQLAYD